MDSTWVQLGIGGAALFILFTLGKLIIEAWTKGDAERTKVIGDGFKSITDSHAAMVKDNREGYRVTAQLVYDHHTNVTGQIGNLRDILIGLDSKVSSIWDLTPVKYPKPETNISIDPTLFTDQPKPEETSATAASTPPRGLRAQSQAERPGPTAQSKAVPRTIEGGEYSTSTKKGTK